MSQDPAVPTVSVVVPNYNYAKTLRACLESVYAQSYPILEVIVVDDQSTDASTEIAGQFPCTLVRHTRNRGAAAARNSGVAASRGDIVFFLDSDVALEPDAVATAVRLLSTDPACGCVHGIHPTEPLFDDGPVERYRTLHMHSALTRATGWIDTAIFALAAVPRAVLDDVGPFDESFQGAGGEDIEYSDRLAARYRILLTDAVVGRHDEEDRLRSLLREQFRRAQLLRFQSGHRMRRNTLTYNSTSGVLAAVLAVGTAPVGLLWWPAFTLPAAALTLFAVADLPLSRLLLRERGLRFLVFGTGVHFLVSLSIVGGVAAGWVRAAIDPGFGPRHRSGPSRTRAAAQTSPDASRPGVRKGA